MNFKKRGTMLLIYKSVSLSYDEISRSVSYIPFYVFAFACSLVVGSQDDITG